jgi:hypothetical protein
MCRDNAVAEPNHEATKLSFKEIESFQNKRMGLPIMPDEHLTLFLPFELQEPFEQARLFHNSNILC